MELTANFDGISLDDLRKTGATKWAKEEGSIGAFVAEMDFGAAPAIQNALHDAVEEGSFGYLPRRLIAQLQDATAEMYGECFNCSIAPKDVNPVPDVIKALQLAIEHHSAPGSKVIVPTPAYMPFILIPEMAGREVIQVPMIGPADHMQLDLEAINVAFQEGGNLLVLCNPYNPVGRVFTIEEMVALSEVVACHDGRVFSDEIWAPLVYEGRHIPYASVNEAAAGHTITAISASKAWNLPGLKCAQVITSNDADREIWERIGFFAGHGVSNLGVTANVAAYREGQNWLAQVVSYLDGNRMLLGELVEQHLPGVRYSPPQGTYISWLDFRDTPLSDGPAEFFAEKAGVHLTDGATCGDGLEGFARFIFATPRPIMREAFARMGKAMRDAE